MAHDKVIFAICPDVTIEELDIGVAVTRLGSGRVVFFNDTGFAIWNLLDGWKALDEVILLLAIQFDLAPEAISQDVSSFIDRLLAAGLILEKRQ